MMIGKFSRENVFSASVLIGVYITNLHLVAELATKPDKDQAILNCGLLYSGQ
jgi:hypothetical protein